MQICLDRKCIFAFLNRSVLNIHSATSIHILLGRLVNVLTAKVRSCNFAMGIVFTIFEFPPEMVYRVQFLRERGLSFGYLIYFIYIIKRSQYTYLNIYRCIDLMKHSY